mgnify:CR=1 FL=1
MEFTIARRWFSSLPSIEVEIDASLESASHGIKLGAAIKVAIEKGANLRGVDLGGADLRGADLGGADLGGADLRGAFAGCPVKIENIHQRVFEAASAEGALDMGTWHVCDTTHCRAGWVVHLAGEAGYALEWALGGSTASAAAMIYLASDPTLEKIPDFYCSNEAALADMERMAALERERQA